MSLEGVTNQILQPYFFYSVVFLIVTFLCVKIFTRFCPFISDRTKSLLYIIPLIVPIVVMVIYFPSTIFQTTVLTIKEDAVVANLRPLGATMVQNFAGSSGPVVVGRPVGTITAPVSSGFLVSVSQVSILSITGILCIIGLTMGVFFALTMIIADDRIARRMLKVILLSSGEHLLLQAIVAESSKKLSIVCPKVGVVEDLRPNAFTIGYGRRATVVFSMGLLNLLNKEEITAVALHELAHVKHYDFFFKTLTSTLMAISFFNPLAYITASAAQRKRELFADEGAVIALDNPLALNSALTKICHSIKILPAAGSFAKTSINLFATSSVLYSSNILSTHPQLDKRLRNISKRKTNNTSFNKKTITFAVMLSIVLLSCFVMCGYSIVGLQQLCYDVNGNVKSPIGQKTPNNLLGEKVFTDPNLHFGGASHAKQPPQGVEQRMLSCNGADAVVVNGVLHDFPIHR